MTIQLVLTLKTRLNEKPIPSSNCAIIIRMPPWIVEYNYATDEDENKLVPNNYCSSLPFCLWIIWRSHSTALK
jgi:hypothetical protein